jgi:hypothetical protein
VQARASLHPLLVAEAGGHLACGCRVARQRSRQAAQQLLVALARFVDGGFALLRRQVGRETQRFIDDREIAVVVHEARAVWNLGVHADPELHVALERRGAGNAGIARRRRDGRGQLLRARQLRTGTRRRGRGRGGDQRRVADRHGSDEPDCQPERRFDVNPLRACRHHLHAPCSV